MSVNYNPSIVRSGLVWCIDPGSPRSYSGTGTNILDASGTNSAAFTINSPTYTSGPGGYFTFNAASLQYAGTSALAGTFSSFTVSIWFYSTDVANYRNPIDCNFNYGTGTSGNIGPRLEQDATGKLLWTMSASTNNALADSFSVIASGMTANTWYNTVITRDGSLVSTYLNGNVVTNQASNPNGFVNVMSNPSIGRGFSLGGSERYFTGRIGAIHIYNSTLSAVQVLQNFNALRGRYGL